MDGASLQALQWVFLHICLTTFKVRRPKKGIWSCTAITSLPPGCLAQDKPSTGGHFGLNLYMFMCSSFWSKFQGDWPFSPPGPQFHPWVFQWVMLWAILSLLVSFRFHNNLVSIYKLDPHWPGALLAGTWSSLSCVHQYRGLHQVTKEPETKPGQIPPQLFLQVISQCTNLVPVYSSWI